MNEQLQPTRFLLYKGENGKIKVDVLVENETVWLTQEQMAELFGKSRSTINEHIKNIYEEKELEEPETMKKFGNSDFSTKPTNFYNLDVIISVGYRVKSLQGTRFRQWATQHLKEFIISNYSPPLCHQFLNPTFSLKNINPSNHIPQSSKLIKSSLARGIHNRTKIGIINSTLF